MKPKADCTAVSLLRTSRVASHRDALCETSYVLLVFCFDVLTNRDDGGRRLCGKGKIVFPTRLFSHTAGSTTRAPLCSHDPTNLIACCTSEYMV